MASNFPGMDEVIRFLQEQERNTRSQGPYGTHPSTATSKANMPKVQAGGAFMKTAGSGQRTLSALGGGLGGAARIATGPAAVGVGLGSGAAIQAGQGLGQAFNNLMSGSSDLYAEGLQPATGSTPGRDRRLGREAR